MCSKTKKKRKRRKSQTKTSNNGVEIQPQEPSNSEVEISPSIPRDFWERQSILALSALLVIVCLTAYYNSLSNDFVWDDRALVLKDKTIRDLGNIPQTFNRDFFDFTEEEEFRYGYYRPIITLSYMLDYAIWGKNPYGYHITNLVVHTICSIFVFWIFLALGLPRHLALLGGTIFGVHPIHTESVSWISGRTDLFCCLFLLAALGCYLANRQNRTFFPLIKKRSIPLSLWFGGSFIFFSLSLFSKEMGIIFIPMIPAIEWFHISKEKKTINWKNILARTAPYLAPTIAYLFLHVMVVERLSNKILKIDMANLYPNIITFFKGFWLYLYKLFLPIHLSAYLKLELLTKLTHPNALFYFFLFIIFFYILAIGSESKPLLGLGGGILLVSMLPLTNIIRITSPKDMGFTMAERFMYIPSIGFILILIVALDWAREEVLKRYTSVKWVPFTVAIYLIGALGYRTVRRNRDWRNDETLFIAETATNSESTLIHSNLGRFYARKGKFDKAVMYMKKALKFSPNNPALLNNLGRIFVDMQEFNEAILYLEKAISLEPDRFQFYNNYGLALAGLGHHKEAIEVYSDAIELRPQAAQVYNNIGVAYKNSGIIEKAEESYLKAIEYDPDYAAPYKNLGIIYLNFLKKPTKAVEALRKSLEIDPSQPDAPIMRNLIFSYDRTKQIK
jgi:Flp pilus assembly protein TadD